MNPEFVAQLTAAVVLAIGVRTAIGATRHPSSRIQMFTRLVGALAILLVVRLIAPFGGRPAGSVVIDRRVVDRNVVDRLTVLIPDSLFSPQKQPRDGEGAGDEQEDRRPDGEADRCRPWRRSS